MSFGWHPAEALLGGEVMSMKGAIDEFSGSLSFKGDFDPHAIVGALTQPTHLLIVMGDRKPSEGFRNSFPTIETIVFDVNGKRYEYDADSVLALLDWWKEQHDLCAKYAKRLTLAGETT